MYRQARWGEPLVHEYPGRRAPPPSPGLEEEIRREVGPLRVPRGLLREEPPGFPQLSEVELIRHYTRLSQMSYGVDSGPVPLGSCTMKYNPRLALRYAWDERITLLHPLQPLETVQGLLEAAYKVQEWLAAITGMDQCSLHPAAGAQGELAGVLMIRRYHELLGDEARRDIIVPDSAHGTNPASAAMAGFRVVEVPTGEDGNVDLEALRSVVGRETAGLMITNPSTLGLFEENILEIARLVHEAGGLLYYDGANLNGILGHARPGDMGFDIAHVNLHKTFSSPHGGGGPGAGPVCARRVPVGDTGLYLTDLLPGPIVVRGEDGLYRLEMPRASIGRLRQWWFQSTVVFWAYIYMLSLGAEGLRRAGEASVAVTNYLLKLLEGAPGLEVPYAPGRPRKHEAVVSVKPLERERGVRAEDVAKGLLDRGVYAPTIYFPLIVEEALMIELTESEPPEGVEAYAASLREVLEEAWRDPESARRWPRNTSVGRVDMVYANHPRSVTPTWRVYQARRRDPSLRLR